MQSDLNPDQASTPRPAGLQRRQISRQKRQDENYLRGASRTRAYSKERKKRRLWDPPGSDSASRRERKDTGTATSAPHPVESHDTATNLARPTMRQRDKCTRRPSRAQPASTWVDLTRSAHAHALIGHWSGRRPAPPESNAHTHRDAGQHPHHPREIDHSVYSRLGARGSGLGSFEIHLESRGILAIRDSRAAGASASARTGGGTQKARPRRACARAE